VTSTLETRATRQLIWPAVFGLLALAGMAVLIGLFVGDGRPQPPLPGLPSAGSGTEWALPFARLFFDLAATVSVGLLLFAAALAPSSKQVLSTAAVRAARLASWSALTWAAAALVVLLLTLSDTLAIPIGQTLNANTLTSYVTQIPQGAAWLTSAALAAFAAVAAREADRPLGAWTGLLVAVAALLPPALTGHAATAGDHDLATSSLVVHIVAVVIWVGGLLAIVWYARTDGRFLGFAAKRFSAVALWAYVAIGVSGVINAVIRFDAVSDLWGSGYGRVLLLKVAAFVVLGYLGWRHRRSTLPALERHQPRAFRRFAVIEAGIMVATVGLAVALSRTPPPPSGSASVPTPAEVLLGFPLPGPPTISSILFDWRLDPLVVAVLLIAAVGYARGVIRLRKRGDHWSVGRGIAWYVGLAILAFAMLSGLGNYGRIVFSLHMTQHMVLSMVAPIFLVIAAPITLALRALPAAGADQPSGPREWLLAALHSPFVRVLTHPITAAALFISAPYIVYFSGLFEVAMRQHWAHELMHVHFVLVGYLFYESLIGRDPIPFRASYPIRLLTLFASLAFHAFFAVAMMSSTSVIAASYYAALNRPWWPDLLSDQNAGSSFAWAFGELPAIIVLIVLLVHWSNDDDRQARRNDRQADRTGDADLAAYNAMLARRSQGRR